MDGVLAYCSEIYILLVECGLDPDAEIKGFRVSARQSPHFFEKLQELVGGNSPDDAVDFAFRYTRWNSKVKWLPRQDG